MNINHELKLISKGALYSFLGNGLAVIFEYLFIILMARLSGVESVGLYILAVTIINILSVIARLGLNEGVLWYMAINKDEQNAGRTKGVLLISLYLTYIMGFAIAALLFFGSYQLAILFHRPGTEIMIRSFALSLPFVAVFRIIMSAFQAAHEMKYVVRYQGLALPLTLIISYLILGAMKLGLLSIGIAFVFSYVFVCVLATRELMASIKRDIKPDYSQSGQLIRFSLPMALVGLLLLTYGQIDTLILGWYQGVVEVGVFGVVIRLSLICAAVIASINYLFSPIIADLYSNGELNKLDKIFKSITRWVIILSLPIYFILLTNYWSILRFFGKEYLLGSVPFFILCTGQLVNFATGSVATVLSMTGKSFLSLVNSALCLIINIVLDFILIPKYGITGAAIAITASLITINVIRLIQVSWLIRIQPYSRRMLIPALTILALFFMVGLLRYMFATGLVKSLIYTALGLIIYVIVIVSTIHKEDQEIFNYLLERTFGKMKNALGQK